MHTLRARNIESRCAWWRRRLCCNYCETVDRPWVPIPKESLPPPERVYDDRTCHDRAHAVNKSGAAVRDALRKKVVALATQDGGHIVVGAGQWMDGREVKKKEEKEEKSA